MQMHMTLIFGGQVFRCLRVNCYLQGNKLDVNTMTLTILLKVRESCISLLAIYW